MKNLNKNRSEGKERSKAKDSKSKENQEKSEKKFFSKERNYFKLKDNILSPKIRNDMQILKLNEGFSSNELKQKYLSLAKLYHPDVIKNDKHVK
jgi:hypothetical protein